MLRDMEARTCVSDRTGIPIQVKRSFEAYSGISLEDVRVHYRSPKPEEVHALAYTQGNQVYIGPGQEKCLGHELGHVIQQKRGRVNPTRQINGIYINDDSAMEREADLIGSRARAVKAGADGHTGVSAADLRSTGQGQAVQCKIGYEFETGWLVEARITSYDKKHHIGSYVSGNGDNMRTNEPVLVGGFAPLKKKDLVYRGPRFTLEADDASDGKAELEFVTEAFEERREVAAVMRDVVHLAMDLQNEADRTNDRGNKQGQSFLWGNFRITPSKQAFVVKSFSKKRTDYRPVMAANPQATVGLPLNLLGRFQPASVGCTAGGGHLRNLILLIGNYIQRGKSDEIAFSPLHYPKLIAEDLMARTDFAKLFELAMTEDNISPEELTKEVWMSAFDQFIQGCSRGLDTPLINRGVWIDENRFNAWVETGEAVEGTDYYIPQLTIGEWLEGIYDNTDRLAQIQDHEGMGSYRDQTDLVKGRPAGIFEDRMLAHTEANLPVEKWMDFALEQFDRLNAILLPDHL